MEGIVYAVSKLAEPSKRIPWPLLGVESFAVIAAIVFQSGVFGACGMRPLNSSMRDHVCTRCHMAFVPQKCSGSQWRKKSLLKSLAGQVRDPDQL